MNVVLWDVAVSEWRENGTTKCKSCGMEEAFASTASSQPLAESKKTGGYPHKPLCVTPQGQSSQRHALLQEPSKIQNGATARRPKGCHNYGWRLQCPGYTRRFTHTTPRCRPLQWRADREQKWLAAQGFLSPKPNSDYGLLLSASSHPQEHMA